MGQSVPRVAPLSGTNHELAGEYWVAKNPTFGTGLATIAAPIAVDDTKPFGYIKGPTTLGKRFALDYIRLVCTAPGTAGSALRLVWRTDDAQADPTGGTQLAPLNLSQDVPATIETKIWFGTNTAAVAGGGVRELIAPLLKNAIPAAGDVFLIKCGGVDQGVSTAAGIVYYGGPPLIVPANKIAKLHLILPSQSVASSYEVELGGWER